MKETGFVSGTGARRRPPPRKVPPACVLLFVLLAAQCAVLWAQGASAGYKFLL
ncbi:hypothetical protein A2U01_0063557, partial [Trifolium medium]|nr:hypothetical protein [Trifolium medium]